MTDEEKVEEQIKKLIRDAVTEAVTEGYLLGLKAGKDEWHKLDWEKDYPEVDRLVRVRTNSGAEYICETYDQTTEDEIGYSNIITQFEELNGDWVDDTEIEYWCYIEPFNFKE